MVDAPSPADGQHLLHRSSRPLHDHKPAQQHKRRASLMALRAFVPAQARGGTKPLLVVTGLAVLLIYCYSAWVVLFGVV